MGTWIVKHKINMETHLFVDAESAEEAATIVEQESHNAIHHHTWLDSCGLAYVKGVRSVSKKEREQLWDQRGLRCLR